MAEVASLFIHLIRVIFEKDEEEDDEGQGDTDNMELQELHEGEGCLDPVQGDTDNMEIQEFHEVELHDPPNTRSTRLSTVSTVSCLVSLEFRIYIHICLQ